MLDLTQIKNFYELKWFDGTILHLRKPSQAMMKRMAALQEVKNLDTQIDEIMDITYSIIENNNEGKVLSDADKELIDFSLASLIIKDYMTKVQEEMGK